MSDAGAGGDAAGREPRVTIRDISKSFAGVQALSRASFAIHAGSVHALLGANGSGKSTLIKILSGYHSPDDGGEVTIDGAALAFGSPSESFKAGCRFVHQDLGLVLELSVEDNLLLPYFPSQLGTVRRRQVREMARRMLKSVGLEVELKSPINQLTAAEQTGVALARALRHDEQYPIRLLVLDEPSASLPPDDADKLHAMIRTAAAQNIGVLLVTHHLDEAAQLGDAVTVLRDGLVVGSFVDMAPQRATLIELITGGAIEPARRPDAASDWSSSRAESVLEVKDLSIRRLRGVSLSVHAGEIIGVAGLAGSGRESLLSAVFGATRYATGSVTVSGEPVRAGRPEESIRLGMGMLPGDRKTASGIMTLTARENLTLADLVPFWAKLRLSRRKESAEASRWLERLDVRPPLAERELSTFSGGNQQKILFGKWIRRPLKVLLLDDPTHGVDVGAKVALHRRLLDLADSGVAIVISSSDLEELEALCNRVLVLVGGQFAATIPGAELSASSLLRAIMGGS